MGLIKKIINRITKKRDILMLDEAKYKDLVAYDKIESLINNMPEGLSELSILCLYWAWKNCVRKSRICIY